MEHISDALADLVKLGLQRVLQKSWGCNLDEIGLLCHVTFQLRRLFSDPKNSKLDKAPYREWKKNYNHWKRRGKPKNHALVSFLLSMKKKLTPKDEKKDQKKAPGATAPKKDQKKAAGAPTPKKDKTKPAGAPAPKKGRGKVPTAEFEEIFSINKLDDPDHVRRILEYWKKNGIICFNLEDLINIREAVCDLVTNIFKPMPYRREHRLNFKLPSGKEVHIDNEGDMDDIVDVFLAGRLSKENWERLQKCLPPHATFGAPCVPGSFHTNTQNKVREDPRMYKAGTLLTFMLCINACFNRCVFRTPKTSGDDMLHWDCDPRAPRGNVDNQVGGKVCITECSFVCVPGSHTPEFLDSFNSVYDPWYPGRKPGCAKYGLSRDKDPWGLFQQQRAFRIPAGHCAFWHELILHSHPSKERDDPVAFGFFMGFRPEGSAEEREMLRQLHRTGGVPFHWPSGDLFHFFPHKFENFPHLWKTVTDKLTPEAHAALVGTRLTKAGKEVPYVRPWGWSEPFKPYPFTELGLCITGQEPWADLDRAVAAR
jgi:hypothetical protein